MISNAVFVLRFFVKTKYDHQYMLSDKSAGWTGTCGDVGMLCHLMVAVFVCFVAWFACIV